VREFCFSITGVFGIVRVRHCACGSSSQWTHGRIIIYAARQRTASLQVIIAASIAAAPLVHPFIRSSVHPFIRSSVHPFIRSSAP
jgi:hypothetical protein